MGTNENKALRNVFTKRSKPLLHHENKRKGEANSAAFKRLYEFGARRVIVTGTGPLGCVPAELALRSCDGNCDYLKNPQAFDRNDRSNKGTFLLAWLGLGVVFWWKVSLWLPQILGEEDKPCVNQCHGKFTTWYLADCTS